MLAPFLPPADARPPGRPARRFEPRNMAFTEDLDRAGALARAVAGLSPGQRHAVTAFYYAGQPAGQIAATPGADRSVTA